MFYLKVIIRILSKHFIFLTSIIMIQQKFYTDLSFRRITHRSLYEKAKEYDEGTRKTKTNKEDDILVPRTRNIWGEKKIVNKKNFVKAILKTQTLPRGRGCDEIVMSKFTESMSHDELVYPTLGNDSDVFPMGFSVFDSARVMSEKLDTWKFPLKVLGMTGHRPDRRT